MSVRVCSPSRSSRFSRLRSVAGLATVLATLGLTACAQETPEQTAYQQALQTAQTDPDFCYSNRYDGVLAQAWQRAHDANADTQQDKATGTPTPTPSVVVTGATVMPELSVPPYSQRSCRLSVKVGDAAPETGFLTFTYLVRNAVTESALAEWHPDKEVVQKYDATMQQIKSGLDMNDPDLKACIARYPALQPNTTDPMVQKAAFDVRAHLVRRCLANKAALKNLYSDLYFIHR